MRRDQERISSAMRVIEGEVVWHSRFSPQAETARRRLDQNIEAQRPARRLMADTIRA
jgi:hypothetical protein